MTKEELAKSKFHGAEKYNCAQAVMAAFREEFDLNEEFIASYSSAGGGRAEGGICGAAHAVKVLLEDSDAIQELEAELERAAGDSTCRQIRKLGMLPCRECVGLSARFLEEHTSKNQ